MRIKFFTSILITIVCLSLVRSSGAEVLFGDHFDSQPDWNMSQNISSLTGWTGKLGSNRGGNFEVGYINSEGARGGTGKGFVQYWDKTSPYVSAQDSWLMKRNINFQNEWYLGYWFKIDPNWDWGSVSSLKLLKIHFNDGTTFDIAWTNFCAGCPDWRVPTGAQFAYCTDEWGKNWAGNWANIADGKWHYFIWRFNHELGILELSIDGVASLPSTGKELYPTNFPGTGWDNAYGISFGGNITDGGGGVNEMWTKFDDMVIATSENEVRVFLGLEENATPKAPAKAYIGEPIE